MKNTYHFVGIGGISMSALAILKKKFKSNVQGSDLHLNKMITRLKTKNIKFFLGHNKNNIDGTDIIVQSAAIKDDNPEIMRAKKLGKKILSRGQVLAEIASKYKNVIAIAGAHGKTTTTEMIAEIFIRSHKHPTVHIGGESNFFNSNLKIGGKKYFICEACEYKNSFLELKNQTGIILNIEKEHLDYFKSFNNIKKSFKKFENNCKNVIKMKIINKNYIIYSNKYQIFAKNIRNNFTGNIIFDCIINNKFWATVEVKSFCEHNVINALFAICVALQFKIKRKIILKALKFFAGVKRRFETISISPLIIHDYSHHPTEIKKTIKTANNILRNNKSFSTNKQKCGKLFIVFQPHTFSRTLLLKKDFINCFKTCNNLVLLKTYSARENYIKQGSSYALAKNLNCKYFASFDKAKKYIQSKITSSDILLILGAGNIDEFALLFKKNNN